MGYSASRFVALHADKFARVAATARQAGKIEALKANGIDAFAFDGVASPELVAKAGEVSHVLVSIPPGEEGDPALNALGEVLVRNPMLRWIGYLSTTAVYGDRGGAWVDEDTDVSPQSARATRRAAAEEGWRALATDTRSVQLFRLSGIYGPGRNTLADFKNGSARRLTKPGHVFNRIHVDDIALVVAAAMEKPQTGPVFNLSDDEPAAVADVVAFAAGLIGVEPPPLLSADEAGLSAMAASFWKENKRISSNRLKAELGIALTYPTYREGLRALHESGEAC